MRLVLDASAAVRLVMRMEGAAVIADRLEAASLVLGPDLFHTVVANALWKTVRAGQLSPELALRRLDEARELIDGQGHDRELLTEALATACQQDHPAYDLLYVVSLSFSWLGRMYGPPGLPGLKTTLSGSAAIGNPWRSHCLRFSAIA